MQPFSASFAAVRNASELLDDPHVLALIEFGSSADEAGTDPRRITVSLPQLGPSPLAESLRNMSTLVKSAETEHGVAIHTLAELSQVKVYVRDGQDHVAIRSHIDEQLGEGVPVIYLGGDLCRKNLLVEIEGLYAG